MSAVTGRLFQYYPATLHDYGRYRIRNQIFPGIIPEPGRCVPGVVYQNVDEPALQLLDLFEDELYVRRTVKVYVNSHEVPAEAYIVARRNRDLVKKSPWNPDQFRQLHMQRYLASCRRFYRAHVNTSVS